MKPFPLLLVVTLTSMFVIACSERDSTGEMQALTDKVEVLAEQVENLTTADTVSEIRELTDTVEVLAEQVESLAKTNTNTRTEVQALADKIDVLVDRVDSLATASATLTREGTGSEVIQWVDGTTAEEAKALLQACISARLGILEPLAEADGSFIQEILGPILEDSDSPFGEDELTAVRFMGGLMGCWE